MIDNIERNMSAAVDYVEQAKTETKAAVVYQKKARRVRILNSYNNIFFAIISCAFRRFDFFF